MLDLTIAESKWLFASCILISSLLAFLPAIYRIDHPKRPGLLCAKAFSAGVFLGAALMHMLQESIIDFHMQGIEFPTATLLAGTTFLVLLWLEHLGQSLSLHHDQSDPSIALLATLMLCFHSIFEGAALGSEITMASSLIIFSAIIAHKWAASFALACHLADTKLSKAKIYSYLTLFALSTPATLLLVYYELDVSSSPLLSPICNAMAAGTFLYIGTLHGLNQAVMIERCCNLRQFIFVIIGFLTMAALAVWV